MNSINCFYTMLNNFLTDWRKSFQQEVVLKKLRAKHPTCVFKKAHIDTVELGKYVSILNGASIQNTSVSDYSYISADSKITNCIIGKFCSIGPNVIIGLGPHPTRNFVSTHPVFYSNNNEGCAYSFREDKSFDDSIPKTVIENDVWIGAKAIIPGNITIRTGAVVAAGSIVTKDIPPYAIVGGNPAKIIRHRFTKEQIETLINSIWWDWPQDRTIKCIEHFANIDNFLKYLTQNK
ncbi:MAG: CatB-related O-acetyltransferase [Desulfobulbaceae bacterium]